MPPKKPKPSRINVKDERTSALLRALSEDDAKRNNWRHTNMTETLYNILLDEAIRRGIGVSVEVTK